MKKQTLIAVVVLSTLSLGAIVLEVPTSGRQAERNTSAKGEAAKFAGFKNSQQNQEVTDFSRVRSDTAKLIEEENFVGASQRLKGLVGKRYERHRVANLLRGVIAERKGDLNSALSEYRLYFEPSFSAEAIAVSGTAKNRLRYAEICYDQQELQSARRVWASLALPVLEQNNAKVDPLVLPDDELRALAFVGIMYGRGGPGEQELDYVQTGYELSPDSPICALAYANACYTFGYHLDAISVSSIGLERAIRDSNEEHIVQFANTKKMAQSASSTGASKQPRSVPSRLVIGPIEISSSGGEDHNESKD